MCGFFHLGLDLAAITKTVVETIRKKGFVCVFVAVHYHGALFLGGYTK